MVLITKKKCIAFDKEPVWPIGDYTLYCLGVRVVVGLLNITAFQQAYRMQPAAEGTELNYFCFLLQIKRKKTGSITMLNMK